ncbi:MAG TPA: hypothetical protein VGC42_18595 [Kofleriaceae bacterium]
MSHIDDGASVEAADLMMRFPGSGLFDRLTQGHPVPDDVASAHLLAARR